MGGLLRLIKMASAVQKSRFLREEPLRGGRVLTHYGREELNDLLGIKTVTLGYLHEPKQVCTERSKNIMWSCGRENVYAYRLDFFFYKELDVVK